MQDSLDIAEEEEQEGMEREGEEEQDPVGQEMDRETLDHI